ncbi:GTPase binding protein Rid1 [Clohesyomyces aquaticus]|uniref:GTPase binding protein Rid1 n=1 Tax=Clohesyomyces aquaticus TaxID=1231657 RepID=A0A1Y1ZS27_9PLEO|nr:GTPase binding protein Rid1 [Clohesyomyces aquaticus]
MATTSAPADRPGHRRNKSSSVLKSIIVPKNHKRSPSDGTMLNSAQPDARPYNPANIATAMPLLPPDHPHNPLRSPAATQNIPIGQPASRRLEEEKKSPAKRPGLHKKTLSSVSLRSLGGKDREKDKDTMKGKQSREPSSAREDTRAAEKPKKTKSSTNLAAMFQKAKSPKPPKHASTPKDKENKTPPSSSSAAAPIQTPIWAQFSRDPFQEVTKTSKVPLNDRWSIEQETALYTPAEYSPSKQRNFFDYGQPSLQKRPAAKERPKSTVVPTSYSTTSLFETLSRKMSSDRNDRVPLSDTKGNEGRSKAASPAKGVSTRSMLQRSSSDSRKSKEKAAKEQASPKKGGNRVMAAVAAFNGKSKESHTGATPPVKLDRKAVEAEFEAVLASRNIPEHQRAQMRTLKLEVKADFVRTHKLDTPQSMSRAPSGHSPIEEPTGKKSSKSTLNRSAKSRDGSDGEDGAPLQATSSESSTKRSRPRSRTFTFSKGDSPVKKQKAEAAANERKSSKANPIPKSPSSRSLVSNGSQRSFSKGQKNSTPDEFVTYMRKTPKPQVVEVGKLHKLRLLLRNETVEWVDDFMKEGGMTELVGLLHRIMEVEWREDHEDQLLHEVLRCLKGLCTTDSALKQLAEIAPTLFPALLAMLFDEEHKGPSDFTTRELLVQILFAHLCSTPEADLPSRATELLKYLKDPVREKQSSTVPFILQMHQPRPYQVWCKEITNVTKEVFWIFIHHLNVIPLPKDTLDVDTKSYAKTHFPGPRAIVPAAPYVGGVEWDATNYIATHLDLLNGLIASLPTKDSRNTLRNEFKVSGFEKLMGHLRACNPKYYGAVHDAVKVWIVAALEDGWDVKPVRMGPSDGKPPGSPVKSSPKKVEKAPQIQAPKMDLGFGLGLDMKFEKEIGGPVRKEKDDDWI